MDVPVSNTAIMADVLKKVSLGDIVTLLRLNAENMAIDELVLPEDSPAVGKRLADLALPACARSWPSLPETASSSREATRHFTPATSC